MPQTFLEAMAGLPPSNTAKPAPAGHGRMQILKADNSKRLLWGWASVVTKAGKPLVDIHNHIIPTGELQRAVHAYVMKGAGIGKVQHKGKPTMQMVDSIVLTADVQEALGIDLGQEGWFTGWKIHDQKAWTAYQAGDLAGLSIGGDGILFPIPTTPAAVAA